MSLNMNNAATIQVTTATLTKSSAMRNEFQMADNVDPTVAIQVATITAEDAITTEAKPLKRCVSRQLLNDFSRKSGSAQNLRSLVGRAGRAGPCAFLKVHPGEAALQSARAHNEEQISRFWAACRENGASGRFPVGDKSDDKPDDDCVHAGLRNYAFDRNNTDATTYSCSLFADLMLRKIQRLYVVTGTDNVTFSIPTSDSCKVDTAFVNRYLQPAILEQLASCKSGKRYQRSDPFPSAFAKKSRIDNYPTSSSSSSALVTKITQQNHPFFGEAFSKTLLGFLMPHEVVFMSWLARSGCKVYNLRTALNCRSSTMDRDLSYLCQECPCKKPYIKFLSRECPLFQATLQSNQWALRNAIATMFSCKMHVTSTVGAPLLKELLDMKKGVIQSFLHLKPVQGDYASTGLVQRISFLLRCKVLHLPGLLIDHLSTDAGEFPYIRVRGNGSGQVAGIILSSHVAMKALDIMCDESSSRSFSSPALEAISLAESFKDYKPIRSRSDTDIHDPAAMVFIPSSSSVWSGYNNIQKLWRLLFGQDYTSVDACVWCQVNIRGRLLPSKVPHCSAHKCHAMSITYLGFDANSSTVAMPVANRTSTSIFVTPTKPTRE
jgi:hypothetical protein